MVQRIADSGPQLFSQVAQVQVLVPEEKEEVDGDEKCRPEERIPVVRSLERRGSWP